MNIRFTKPCFKNKEENDNSSAISANKVEECKEYIAEFEAYMNGLIVRLGLAIVLCLYMTIAFKWYLLFVGLPLVIYSIRTFNLARFELSIHKLMCAFIHECVVLDTTGQWGPITSHVLRDNN
ncbi:MAG: hypothetical protein ACKOX7_03090 [Bacteroidota bacterium]|jgi:hypothetical protein